jgi:Na+/melibiose symporter-like transporter
MGILAAWVAGFTIDAIGVGGVYYAIVGFHVLTALVVAQLPSIVADRSTVNSVWADLVEGVRYVFRQRALVPLLALALAVVLFGRPYRTLMPKFAKDVMGFEAAGLGLLMAAPEVGSLVSSLAVASLGDFRGKGKLLLAAGVALGASLLLYAHVQALALVLLFLALVGAASNISQVTSQTLVQSGSTDRFQGRMMSVYMVLGGLTPLGTMPAGVIADRLGVPAAVGIEGVLLVLIFAGMAAWGARVRRME